MNSDLYDVVIAWCSIVPAYSHSSITFDSSYLVEFAVLIFVIMCYKICSGGYCDHNMSFSQCNFKGTLHSKSTLEFFSCPKSIYFCHLSIASCTLLKLQLREQGTNLYRGAGEFDGRCHIHLEIWNQSVPWLRHGTADDTV